MHCIAYIFYLNSRFKTNEIEEATWLVKFDIQTLHNMLEEIIACFLSLFSALTLDAPHLRREIDHNEGPSEQYIPQLQAEYVQLGNELRNKPTYVQSLVKSIKATFTLTLAVLPLAITGIAFIYFALRTTYLCHEWQAENYTLSYNVKKIRLLGRGVVVAVMYHWIPFSLTVMFGWSEFRRHYYLTILVGQLVGLLNTLYISILFLYGIDDDGTIGIYFVPAYIMFGVAVLWQCLIVMRNVQQNNPTISYSRWHIFMVLSVTYLTSFALGLFYKYAVVMWFNSIHNALYRFMLAILTPSLAVVPTALCRHMALWRTSEIIEPERGFALVYLTQVVSISLYRIMQANFGNIWLFVGLSLLSSVSSLLKAATVGIRNKVWARIIKFLNKTCCTRLRHLPGGTVRHRRLKADTEIQNLLFENISLILSQSYIVLNMITSFELSDWSVLRSSLIRVAIGLGIEFVFNILSTFVRIHWYDIPVARVWSKYWKRHMFANGIAVVLLVSYFTKPLLTVFKTRYHDISVAANYTIRNCTLPYEDWR